MEAITQSITEPITSAITGPDSPFDYEDLTSGTLILNFVDRPPDYTLSLNFLTETYEIWEADTTVSGSVGYFMRKA